MSDVVDYIRGAELPDTGISWYDAQGGLIDFTVGWTFTVKVGLTSATALLTKTTGIVGSATAPNVKIAWAANELNPLPVGLYVLQIFALHVATGKDRARQALIHIRDAVN